MSSEVQRHCDTHLAPIYVWMVGDVAAALGAAGISSRLPACSPGRAWASRSIFGCGFGLQAIPLAELGYGVVALDFSAELLGELRSRVGTLPIRTCSGGRAEFPAPPHRTGRSDRVHGRRAGALASR
jgi:hypothetical protein